MGGDGKDTFDSSGKFVFHDHFGLQGNGHAGLQDILLALGDDGGFDQFVTNAVADEPNLASWRAQETVGTPQGIGAFQGQLKKLTCRYAGPWTSSMPAVSCTRT